MLFAAFAARNCESAAFRGYCETLTPLLLTSVPLYAPTVAVLALGVHRGLALDGLHSSSFPALAIRRGSGMYQHQRQLAEDLKRANMCRFAEALVATLERSDRYRGHSKAVAISPRHC